MFKRSSKRTTAILKDFLAFLEQTIEDFQKQRDRLIKVSGASSSRAEFDSYHVMIEAVDSSLQQLQQDYDQIMREHNEALRKLRKAAIRDANEKWQEDDEEIEEDEDI